MEFYITIFKILIDNRQTTCQKLLKINLDQLHDLIKKKFIRKKIKMNLNYQNIH